MLDGLSVIFSISVLFVSNVRLRSLGDSDARFGTMPRLADRHILYVEADSSMAGAARGTDRAEAHGENREFAIVCNASVTFRNHRYDAKLMAFI